MTTKGKKLSLRKREVITGYLFLSPFFIGLALFILGPMAVALRYSLTNFTGLGAYEWVGVRNYVRAFMEDRLFWKSLYNTFYYVGLSTPLHVVTGFFLAILLNVKIKEMTVYRSIYYLPHIIPIVVTCMIFLYLFNPQVGIMNYFLDIFGLPMIPWLTSETWSKPSLIILRLWGVGGTMVIYLVGFQSIPIQLYEAADLDGANWSKRFIFITVPMMTPFIFLNLILGMINSFQVFAPAFIITQGRPLNSTLFYMLHVYKQCFGYFRMAYGCALALILFGAVLIIIIILFRFSRSWVYYRVEQ